MVSSRSTARAGVVYLVGSGPGDPGLITVRGRELVERADVILYDNLAAPAVLGWARPGAERIYVGKKRAQHTFTQDEINRMLVDHARGGRVVVRLKGGDPFIFGRGGEEADALAEAGVPFEIVPGVTSPAGVAAYSGIPLTHRTKTSAVTFVTGHDAGHIDWSKLGTAETLVIFMGLTTFPEIARRLIAEGRDPTTPAAAVRWATRGDQVTLEGTLETLPGKIAGSGMRPPALIIVGEVVALRQRLNWFERLPLFGQRIVVTRAAEQAAELSERLRRLGARPVEIPAIAFAPPEEWTPLDRAIGELECYDWLIFTSANGVRFFVERLDALGVDLRRIHGKLCAIGPATAAALRRLHLRVELMPSEYVAESVLEAFDQHDLAGKRILLPRAAVARDLMPRELEKRGALVDVVPAYRTVMPEESWAVARQLLSHGEAPHWITFTSSSTVTNFSRLAPPELLRQARVASIGPVTSETARKLGLEVHVEAREYTIDGLLEALIEACAAEKIPVEV